MATLTTIAPATINPGQLYQELAAVNGLAPFTDAQGNIQSSYRLDQNPNGTYTITFRDTATKQNVDAVISAHVSNTGPSPEQANASAVATSLKNAMSGLQSGIDAINAGTITPVQRDQLLKLLAQCSRQEIRVLMSLYDATG